MKQISERQLIVPTLQYLKSRENGYATTSEIIEHLNYKIGPTGEDLEILKNRNDTRMSQKIRNMICHRHSHSSFIKKGLAEYKENGLKITKLGKNLI